MRKSKVWWIAIVVGLVGLVALAMRPRPLAVEVGPVTRGPMRVTLDEEGRTQVKRRYVVSAPLAGKLLRIERKAGDRVDEGAVLARLVPADAPLLDPRSRAEQEARLHASEAAVEQANANVARAQVADGAARDDLERKRGLAAKNAISAHELELASTEAAARTQDLASAQFGAKVADHQLVQARAALQRGRSGRLDEFEIVAPASGQVLRVISTDPGSVCDMAVFAEQTGHALLEQTSEASKFVFYLKKA